MTDTLDMFSIVRKSYAISKQLSKIAQTQDNIKYVCDQLGIKDIEY